MSYRSEELAELAVDLVRQHPRLTAAEVSDRLMVKEAAGSTYSCPPFRGQCQPKQ
jgi:hypothetical protein